MTKYERYAKVRLALIKLEGQRRELELSIGKELQALDGTLKTKYGTLYTTSRKVWTYKPEVMEKLVHAKNSITEIQHNAQKNGLADYQETYSVGFRTQEGKL